MCTKFLMPDFTSAGTSHAVAFTYDSFFLIGSRNNSKYQPIHFINKIFNNVNSSNQPKYANKVNNLVALLKIHLTLQV